MFCYYIFALFFLINSQQNLSNFMNKIALFFVFNLLVFNLMAQKNVEEHIKILETKRFEAQIKKDKATLDEILADDLVYIHSNAMLENKAEYIANVASAKWDYRKIDEEESLVRVYETTAVVTGKARMTLWMNNAEVPILMRYTDVYAKHNGKWQMVSWCATRVNN